MCDESWGESTLRSPARLRARLVFPKEVCKEVCQQKVTEMGLMTLIGEEEMDFQRFCVKDVDSARCAQQIQTVTSDGLRKKG